MRAIAVGSVVLAFAVVLLCWDASRRSDPVGEAQPSIEISDTRANAIGRPEPETIALQAEPLKPLARARAPATAEAAPATPTSAASPRAGTTVNPIAAEGIELPSQAAALPGVRRYTPGSKEHVEALLTAIDSEESRSTVAPIARLYFAFLERPSDYEGLNYWIGERDSGTSLQAIADQFAGSNEFHQRYGALDNAAFVDRIYRNVFEGVPDSGQRAHWVAQLDAGMSRGEVVLAFSESNAYRTATVNEVFVTMAYAEALRGAPDPAGFNRWVRFLDEGNPREGVISGLLGKASQ